MLNFPSPRVTYVACEDDQGTRSACRRRRLPVAADQCLDSALRRVAPSARRGGQPRHRSRPRLAPRQVRRAPCRGSAAQNSREAAPGVRPPAAPGFRAPCAHRSRVSGASAKRRTSRSHASGSARPTPTAIGGLDVGRGNHHLALGQGRPDFPLQAEHQVGRVNERQRPRRHDDVVGIGQQQIAEKARGVPAADADVMPRARSRVRRGPARRAPRRGRARPRRRSAGQAGVSCQPFARRPRR